MHGNLAGPAARRDELGRTQRLSLRRHALQPPPDLAAFHAPVVRRPGVPVACERVVLPGRVIGPAFVDQKLPGAEYGIAHRIAAFVVGLSGLAHSCAALAVLTGRTVLELPFAAHALVGVGVGIAHRAGERGPARGQRPAESGIGQAGGECHRRAARRARGPACLQPVQHRRLAIRSAAGVGMGRCLDRAVIAADALETLGREIDQQRVFAITRPHAAQGPVGKPAAAGRRNRAAPARDACAIRIGSAGGALENIALQAAPGRGHRARMGQRFLAVDTFVRGLLRARRGGSEKRAQADPGQHGCAECSTHGLPPRLETVRNCLPGRGPARGIPQASSPPGPRGGHAGAMIHPRRDPAR